MVWRREIQPHPNNPRHISLTARRKLKDEIKRVGILEPTIVSERTGHVLGGHQRLSIMDELQRYDAETRKNDYRLQVAYVDCDEREELKLLVFLNNPAAQGDWNLDGLAELNIDHGISFNDMGFDPMDVQIMFDGDPRFVTGFEDEPEVKTEAQKAAEIAAIKEAKKQARDKFAQTNTLNYYVRVYGKSGEELEELLRALGIPVWETEIYVGSILELLPQQAEPQQGASETGNPSQEPEQSSDRPDQTGQADPEPAETQSEQPPQDATPKGRSRKAQEPRPDAS